MHRKPDFGDRPDSLTASNQNTCPQGAVSPTQNPGNNAGAMSHVRIVTGILDHRGLGLIISPGAFRNRHGVPEFSGKPYRYQ